MMKLTSVLSFFGVDLAQEVERLTAKNEFLTERLDHALIGMARADSACTSLAEDFINLGAYRDRVEQELVEANRTLDATREKLSVSIDERIALQTRAKNAEAALVKAEAALREMGELEREAMARLEDDNAKLREGAADLAIKLERALIARSSAQLSTGGAEPPLFRAGAPGVCRECGCTEDSACEGGCRWEDEERTICSACAAPLRDEPKYEVVYDGVTEHLFQIVRLSFREKNKWCLSQGKESLEIGAFIVDKEWIAKVDARQVFFASGDLVKVRLRTVTRRRGNEAPLTTYTVEKVHGVIQPSSEQLSLKITELTEAR